MPTDRVDYPIVPTGKIRTPNASLHNGRINKVVNRMNITSNPLAGDGEKVYSSIQLKMYVGTNNLICFASSFQY